MLQAACKTNGFRCLEIMSSTLFEAIDRNEFSYQIQFANSNGSLFILGPWCGASKEIVPPISSFEVHVTCESEGLCQVMDLPPYVP
jgi:hypothetical protein